MLEQERNEQTSSLGGHAAVDGGSASASSATSTTSAASASSAASAEWVEAQLSQLELLLSARSEPALTAALLLRELAPRVRAVQGAAYVLAPGAAQLSLAAGYAAGDDLPPSIPLGEGLLGACAKERELCLVSEVPSDYFRVQSALGARAPASLALVPVALDAGALAVLELAFLARGPSVDDLLDRLSRWGRDGAPSSGAPEPLRRSSAATHPASRARATRRSGLWSLLSHELRSPLNSVIVLSQVLAENAEHNLTDRQVHLARVIHGSGKDLLGLVDSVALLAKLEARRLVLAPGELDVAALARNVQRALEPLAAARGAVLRVALEPGAPRAILTDPPRARQIVECMLVAGIERSEGGAVELRIGRSRSGWSRGRGRLDAAPAVLALRTIVSEAAAEPARLDEVRLVEAAADDGATRRGEAALDGSPGRGPAEPEPGAASPGTLARAGLLGLAISGELAALLGGELQHDGASSALTLYLPAFERARDDATPGLPPELVEGHAAGPAEGAGPAQSAGLAEAAGAADGAALMPTESRPRAPLALGELWGLELLLIDPDVRHAFTLTGQLERHGAAVVHADDVSEALERVRRRVPAAVLIDARALGESGEPSLQRLLRLAEHTPLIVLREAGESLTPLPHVYAAPRSADAEEVVALIRRVAAPAGSLHNRGL